MIPMNRDHQALTPSCTVARPPAVPECRKAASSAVAAGAYVKSVQRSQVRPVFAHRSGHLFGLHEGSAAGSILHVACTWPGIPWFDMTWKLNELERLE